jgi:hypothetical protein
VKPTVQQLESLLALKRHERPEGDYWQGFLCEFHQRQREQSVARSGLKGLTGRVSSWFAEVGPSKWAYGAGLAYAAVTVAFILSPRDGGVQNVPASPVNYQVIPSEAPVVEQLDQLDLSPSTQGSVGEQVF